jgi:tetratricopeptide (TPR) repeat protein
MRLGLLFFTPLVVLLLAEGSLRVFGYGYPVTFFQESPDSQLLITNQKYAWQFFSKKTALKPFLFTLAPKKPAGTLRICILGDSAAMGTPDPAFSFGRILEAILRRRYPQTRFEVMNAAMRGINSHVSRLIARECARYEVDVFIIYMGNNEVVGIHGPDPGSPPWAQSLTLIRAAHWVRATKLGQLLSGAFGSATEPHGQDMAYFRDHRLRADDWRRDKNRKNFQANLEDILQTTTSSGAKVILSTVAVNLKDFPPLGSLHRADLAPQQLAQWEAFANAGMDLESKGRFREALDQYLTAAQVDAHFAALHFRLARCYAALQDWPHAKEQFVLARDWDALQFRTDSPQNQLIRHVAEAHKQDGVALLDTEQSFAQSDLSDHELPGEKLFYEHVHPTFAGNYLLARGCYNELVSVLADRLPQKPIREIPTQDQCAQDIAYTSYDDVNVNAAMARLTSGPPFLDQLDHALRQAAAEAANKKSLAAFGPTEAQASLSTYLNALVQRPDDWPIHFNLALFCQELKRNSQAVEQFEYLVHRFPQIKPFRVGLASSLLSTGNKVEALAQFQEALRLDPEDNDLRKQVDELALRPIFPN